MGNKNSMLARRWEIGVDRNNLKKCRTGRDEKTILPQVDSFNFKLRLRTDQIGKNFSFVYESFWFVPSMSFHWDMWEPEDDTPKKS